MDAGVWVYSTTTEFSHLISDLFSVLSCLDWSVESMNSAWELGDSRADEQNYILKIFMEIRIYYF